VTTFLLHAKLHLLGLGHSSAGDLLLWRAARLVMPDHRRHFRLNRLEPFHLPVLLCLQILPHLHLLFLVARHLLLLVLHLLQITFMVVLGEGGLQRRRQNGAHLRRLVRVKVSLHIYAFKVQIIFEFFI